LTIHSAGQTIKKRIADDSPDKAKPFAKRGRKAAGLHGKMAELPKEVFLWCARCFISAEVTGE
jgi:hypothetical protein